MLIETWGIPPNRSFLWLGILATTQLRIVPFQVILFQNWDLPRASQNSKTTTNQTNKTNKTNKSIKTNKTNKSIKTKQNKQNKQNKQTNKTNKNKTKNRTEQNRTEQNKQTDKSSCVIKRLWTSTWGFLYLWSQHNTAIILEASWHRIGLVRWGIFCLATVDEELQVFFPTTCSFNEKDSNGIWYLYG